MMVRLHGAWGRLAVALLVVGGFQAEAAELKLLSSLGMQTVFEELAPKFERATGHKLAMTFDSAGGVLKRVHGGEITDVVVTVQQGIERFAKDGKAIPDSVTFIAQSGIGLAVRTGAQKPDISSAEALKRTLLAARSITYANPALGAASGIHFARVLERLGIAEEMKSKTIFLPKPGPVGVLVADGQAEVAIHQFPELIQVAGIELVGPLPGDLQDTILFSGAIMVSSKDIDASKALISFLRTPEAALAIKAKGMEPA